MSYVIFDIETVTDLTLWTPPQPEPAAPEVPADPAAAAPSAEQKPAKRSRKKKSEAPAQSGEAPFAPLYAHRPIAFGFVWLDDDLSVKSFGCVGTSQYGDDERRLLTDWTQFMVSAQPTLVSWYGRNFDMAVVTLRTLLHGIPQRWYSHEYRHKYNEDRHLDLSDQLADYNPRVHLSLDILCKMIGLPEKNGVDGSKVAGLFTQPGGVEQIETYCLTDAMKTAFGFLRYMLMRGRIDMIAYQRAAQALGQACRTDNRLLPFVQAIDWKRLLLEG